MKSRAFSSKRGLFFTVKGSRAEGMGFGGVWGWVRRSGFLTENLQGEGGGRGARDGGGRGCPLKGGCGARGPFTAKKRPLSMKTP